MPSPSREAALTPLRPSNQRHENRASSQPYLSTVLKRMTSEQDNILEELVGVGMMIPEEADNAGWQNREEQERATTREELEVLVRAGDLSQEDADLQVRMNPIALRWRKSWGRSWRGWTKPPRRRTT